MKRIAYASLFTLALAHQGPAQAQAPGSAGIVGHVPGRIGHVVGGGFATMHGGGDELVIVYGGGGAGGGGGLTTQPGRLARLLGGEAAGGPQVEYLEPAPRGRGREAWMIGSGDGGAEVVYAPPY